MIFREIQKSKKNLETGSFLEIMMLKYIFNPFSLCAKITCQELDLIIRIKSDAEEKRDSSCLHTHTNFPKRIIKEAPILGQLKKKRGSKTGSTNR